VSKQKVSLIFPDLKRLWAFAQAIHAPSLEIIASTKTLICDCEDLDIQLAQEKFGARVVQEN